MVWNEKTNKYHCDGCELVLTESDIVIQVQLGYLLDEGQSFEEDNSPDFHYHEACYVKKLRK